MSTHQLCHGDCQDQESPIWNPKRSWPPLKYACCFMDPPDAIDLKRSGYIERPKDGYIPWLTSIIGAAIEHCGIVWVSYNAIWDLPLKSWVHHALLGWRKIEVKPFVWTYTFGQNRKTDCGPGFRPMLRFRHEDAELYPDQIKVPSVRMLTGDKRAAPGGKVPLDAWSDFPRVVGNAKERRNWCPTQHPEGLVERAIKLSTKEGDTVLDLFSGTGTAIRVCKRINRNSVSAELSQGYCGELLKEHDRLVMLG